MLLLFCLSLGGSRGREILPPRHHETPAHVYLERARFQPLLRLLHNLLLRFWLHVSPYLFIHAHFIRGPAKSRRQAQDVAGRGWLREGPVALGPISAPVSVHASRQSSTGRCPLTFSIPFGAVGAVQGSLLRVLTRLVLTLGLPPHPCFLFVPSEHLAFWALWTLPLGWEKIL